MSATAEPPIADAPAGPAPVRHAHHFVAFGVVVALIAALVAWIALTPLPPAGAPLVPWISVQAPGYRIDLPTPPSTATVAFGAGHVATSVDGPNAFTVIWFPTETGVDPTMVMSRALQALQKEPATLTLTRPGVTGPFPSAEVAARLPAGYLRGRMLVVGRRTYLIAEITPGEAVSPDFIRLLSGFDPDPTAA